MVFPSNDVSSWHFGRLNQRTDFTGSGTRCLVVFVPGLFRSWPGFQNYDDLLSLLDRQLSKRFATRDLLPVSYLATYWSPSNPDAIARDIIQRIDTLTQQHNYNAIFLVSHSFGGLLARRLMILGQHLAWFAKLERALFLASTSRGLHPATRVQQLATSGGKSLGDWSFLDRCSLGWLRFGRLALSGMKPSPWLTSLSNDWRSLLATTAGQQLQIVQLLGELDRVVDPAADDDLICHTHFHSQVIPAVRHRYFMLRQDWCDHADPAIRAALALTQEAIANSLQ